MLKISAILENKYSMQKRRMTEKIKKPDFIPAKVIQRQNTSLQVKAQKSTNTVWRSILNIFNEQTHLLPNKMCTFGVRNLVWFSSITLLWEFMEQDVV